jgi:hypothetical protein
MLKPDSEIYGIPWSTWVAQAAKAFILSATPARRLVLARAGFTHFYRVARAALVHTSPYEFLTSDEYRFIYERVRDQSRLDVEKNPDLEYQWESRRNRSAQRAHDCELQHHADAEAPVGDAGIVVENRQGVVH